MGKYLEPWNAKQIRLLLTYRLGVRLVAYKGTSTGIYHCLASK